MTTTGIYRQLVSADQRANRGYPKSQLILLLFRVTQCVRELRCGSRGAKALYPFVAALYKIASEWILGVELPASTRCGPGLRLRHGVGVVVNPGSVIGANVMIRHGVTLGNRRSVDDCPEIEDDVEIGVGAVIIGDVTVGKGAKIGPNVVVVKDVPAGAVLYSPPSAVRE